MEKKSNIRKVSINKEGRQWNLYQHLGKFNRKLGETPDAAAVLRNPPACAPQALSDMVF